MKLIGMFSPSGRMNRKRFIRVNLLFIAWSIFFLPIWFMVACWHGFFGLFDKPNILYWTLVCVSWFLFSGAPFVIVANIRRWHDLNKSGWLTLISAPIFFALANIIPWGIASIIYAHWVGIIISSIAIMITVYMCCAKGTDGDNKYGKPQV